MSYRPGDPAYYPGMHSFPDDTGGCVRCGALPGDGVACEPPRPLPAPSPSQQGGHVLPRREHVWTTTYAVPVCWVCNAVYRTHEGTPCPGETPR